MGDARHADECLVVCIEAVRRRLIRDAWRSIFPEVFEPVRRQGRVADGGHDRSVAEIGLDGARPFVASTRTHVT